MSFMAIRHYAAGDPEDAALIARAARNQVASAAIPHLNAMLYLTEARAHALAGDSTKAYRAVDRAVDEFENGSRTSLPAWLYWVSHGELLGQAGSCALDLGDLAKADDLLEAAADQYGDHANRSATLHSVRRAIALARDGNVEQASAVAARALRPAMPVRSRRFAEHLAVLANELPADSHDEDVGEAREAIRRYQRLAA
jgi:tetratricopeptide (TPR) repeat protein